MNDISFRNQLWKHIFKQLEMNANFHYDQNSEWFTHSKMKKYVCGANKFNDQSPKYTDSMVQKTHKIHTHSYTSL